jgi:hypothetical protein
MSFRTKTIVNEIVRLMIPNLHEFRTWDIFLATSELSYGPPWAHYLGGYQDRLLGGPLGLPDLCHMVPDGMRRKDYDGEVLG